MEAVIFKAFGVLFRFMGILLLTGTVVAVLSDVQHRAFVSHRTGLVSLLRINSQLVGPTK